MGIGFRELLIILVIALVIFGAKRLKTIGSDLGGAVKGFKKAMSEERRGGEQAVVRTRRKGCRFRFDAGESSRQDTSCLKRVVSELQCSKSVSARSS